MADPQGAERRREEAERRAKVTLYPDAEGTASLAGYSLPGVHDLKLDGNEVRFDVDADELDEVLRHLSAAGVRSLVSEPPTLEELFLRHYQMAGTAAADKPHWGANAPAGA